MDAQLNTQQNTQLINNDQIRNIAIIAHVDHGKTTLVDAMFRQSGIFREGQSVSDRLMDNMDLERERGITIAAKNCSVEWRGVKINIIDTPGHADFGGEVERALSMADGALLLVDASEGPLPQTRFVLEKTLAAGLKVIVVINKIDRKDARPEQVLDQVYDLFIDLDANEEQLDFSYLYAIGRSGVAQVRPDKAGTNLDPLFDLILEKIPAPRHQAEAPFQMLVSDLGYSDYLGRLAVGRVADGHVRNKDALVCIGSDGVQRPLKVACLQNYAGPTLVEVETAEPGDIVVLAGIDEVRIGDTICTRSTTTAMKRIRVDEPTVSMRFTINTSPFAGREGRFSQSRNLRERLFKETLRNVAIQVEETENREVFLVKGRGEFQLAIFIETMRREGFELSVGRPDVIYRMQGRGQARTDGEAVCRLRRAVHGRGHGKAFIAQGPDDESDQSWQRPGADRVHHPGSGIDRLSGRISDRHKRNRFAEHLFCRLRHLSRRYSQPLYRFDCLGSPGCGRGLRLVQPGAARAAVCPARRTRVRGHDFRRAQPGHRSECQSVQGEKVDQHAGVGP